MAGILGIGYIRRSSLLGMDAPVGRGADCRYRRRIRMLRKGFLAALLLGAVGPLGPIASAAACDGDGQSPAQISQLVATQAILCRTNDRRTEAGLSPLNENHHLDKAAQGHAHWMAKHNSYGHGNPANRIRRSGYLAGATAWRVGEILNWGTDQ